MNPKVSILIPVYNAEKYVEKCLQSVFCQTYQDLEVIVIDDATPDNSMSFVNTMAQQITSENISLRIIHHETNKGIAETRNELLENATGDYLLFVDSDDYIAKDAVEQLVDRAVRTGADLIRCNYIAVKNRTETIVRIPPFKDKEHLLRRHIAAWDSTEAMWQLFISRSLIEKANIRFAKGINAAEDHLMLIKLYYYAQHITDADRPFYYYRIDNEQSVTHVNPAAFHLSMYKAMDKAIAFLKKEGVYDAFREEALTRTFLTKQTFLLNKDNRDIDFYMDEHPECNSYYRKFNFNLSQKILFKLAELRQRSALKILTRLF